VTNGTAATPAAGSVSISYDPPVRVTVTKALVPATAGGRFNLRVDGTVVAANAADGGSGFLDVPFASNVTVDEVAGSLMPAGETLSSYTTAINCGSGSVASTSLVINVTANTTCTITNTRRTGQLRVIKSLSPASNSGRFNLQIDSVTQAADVGDGGNTGLQTLNTGSHTVGETAGTATTLANYTSAIVCKDTDGAGATVASGSGAGPLSVPVTSGAQIACTITNTRIVVTPTLSTNASSGVILGGAVHDTASISAGQSPTGQITFRLYGPNDATCSGAPVFTNIKTVAGNAAYQSDDFTPLQVGTYRWTASYGGDEGNNPVTAACNAPNETVTVSQASATLTASGSPNVTLGGVISATGTLAGGSSPTGTLTFRAYGPDDPTCARGDVFSSARSVAGNGTYQSAEFKPARSGEYKWIVAYSGDNSNAPATTACGAATQVGASTKTNQTITFAALTAKTLSDSPVTVSATASSGLAVTFSSLTPLVCTVAGSSVTLKSIGTCTIAADQIGDATYNAAPQVARSFAVTAGCGAASLLPAQLPAGIVALPYSQTVTVGTGEATFTLTGTLPPGLTFVNGVLSGTPTTRGSSSITITATDANSCQTSRTYALAISAERRLLVGAGVGASGITRAFNLASATPVLTKVFGSSTDSGTSVAEADVDGDGYADGITTSGPDGFTGPSIVVFNPLTGDSSIFFHPFPIDAPTRVEVAAGDVTGDGLPEILAVPGCASGNTQIVRAFGRTGGLVREYAVGATVASCGLHIGAGDVNGDGVADLVVGSAGLGPAFVRVLDGVSGGLIREFFPYSSAYTGGVYVAAGDVNGDGFADIVTGAGAGGTPHVRVFDGVTGTQIPGVLGSFLAYPSAFSGGVRVAAGDLNGDGKAEVITGAGPGGGPHVRVFDGATATEIFGLFAFDPTFTGGVFVAAPVPSARMAIDVAARTTGTGLRAAGWALREIAADTNGNDAIDVWAYPVAGGAPIFVASAPSRIARPDVATAFGGEFLNSGFDIAGTLAPGTYDVVVFARNIRTQKFDQVRVVRITVP